VARPPGRLKPTEGAALIRVYHLNCGTLRPLGGRLVDGQPGLLRRAEMVCHCLLLETGTGLTLVDTGFGATAAKDASGWLGGPFVRLASADTSPAQTAVAQVTGLGFDPRDVRDIVLTHLDFDHAGGLADFPDATVHVYEKELEAARHPRDRKERMRYRPVQFAHGPKWAPCTEQGEPWFGFGAVRELGGLPPEILLVPLAGHTRGHAGVAVDTGNGWLLHAGDSFFHAGETAPEGPRCPPGLALFESAVQTGRAARLRNQERLRTLARDHADDVRVFCAHDTAQYRRLAGPAGLS
jgi:glyoxylase-like metal-dependent hydrolase (beta-lactamase superfamily II)